MNKEEFLQQLAQELAPLSETERARALDYFREMICDGLESGQAEPDVIAAFGPVHEIAAQILRDTAAMPSAGGMQGGMPGAAPLYVAKGAVQKVIVDSRNTTIDLIPTSGGPIQIHFSPRDTDQVECREANGVFSFYHRIQLFSLQNLFAGPRRITVEIPADFAGELEIHTSNVALRAGGFRALCAAQFTTSNGRISLSDMACGTLFAHTSNGTMDVQALSGGACRLETCNGRIHAEHCLFPAGFALYTQNGAIHADGIQSDAIEYSTNNGAVSSVILGDMREYAVRSHTSNASSTLPPELIYPEQHKRLNVSTSNGRIDVRFAAALI